MKTRQNPLKPIIVLLVLALMASIGQERAAAREPGAGPHILLKISRLSETLDLIDTLASELGDPSMGQPVDIVRGMMQGTDWIDPKRLIVIGVDLKGDAPLLVALVPYRKEKETFKQAFGAKAGADYYIFALPPGSAAPIERNMERKLVTASTSKPESLISAEIEAHDLVESQRDKVDAMMAHIDARDPSKSTMTGRSFAPSPEQSKEMLRSMIDAFSQMKTMTLGVDMTTKNLSYISGARAMPGSELESIFQSVGDTTLFHDYRPDMQATFKTRSFDCEGVFDMLNDIFGDYYADTGMDLTPITDTMGYYTGEFAGGLSFGKKGSEFEWLAVLKDGDHVKNFSEDRYIPSLLNYMSGMKQMMEKQSGRKMRPLYIRTKDSMVEGLKVVGIKSQSPFEPDPDDPVPDTDPFHAEMRLTTVGNLLVMANDDKRLEELIRKAKTFKEKKTRGPMMTGGIAFGDYMSGVMNALPVMSGQAPSLPKLGRMRYVSHIAGSRANFKFTMSMDDIKSIAALVNQAKGGGKGGPTVPASGPKAKKPAVAAVKTKVYTEKDPEYWFDRGSMCMIAANDTGAIRNLKQALKLDPDRREVHYQLGVAYGNIGDYEKAHMHIDKALSLGTDKGLYHYARGRMHLMAGDVDKARADFEIAAEHRNQDAENYLRSAGKH